jgi:hypothetical protein
MNKFELCKTIEARKLNKRTGIPLTGPLTTIPYGTIVTDPVVDRDVVKFTYLNEFYQCTDEVFQDATVSLQADETSTPSQTGSPTVSSQPVLHWASIDTNRGRLYRVKVPGGWLISTESMNALSFYPDQQHSWDPAAL